jgi:hypothetical protein
VALEALGRGRPVINLVISDFVDPDPVLEGVDLHCTADTPQAPAAAARGNRGARRDGADAPGDQAFLPA